MSESAVIDTLSQLFEERLGGMMLVRLGLTDLVERFKQEEHALAISLKTILRLRDEERNAFHAQLDSAHAYARQLEAQLHEAHRLAAQRFDVPPLTTPFTPPSAAPASNAVAHAHACHASHAAHAASDAAAMAAVAARLNSSGQDFSKGVHSVTDGVNVPSRAAQPIQPPDERSRSPAKGEQEGGGVESSYAAPVAASPIGEPPTQEPPPPEPPPPPQAPPQPSYLARVEQLQQRLARERSSLRPNPAAKAQPPPAMPSAFGGGAGSKRQSSGAVAEAADPFDNFERGELRTTPLPPTAQDPGTLAQLARPPNPAIVTAGGEAFSFRHGVS